MSEATVSLFMWGVGILFAVIGFFLSFYFIRSIKQQDETSKTINETHKELSGSINKLQVAITGLNGVILSMQDKNDVFIGSCKEKHITIDSRLNEHGRRLDEHERKIVEFDIKVNQ